jgi:hypothetical protein
MTYRSALALITRPDQAIERQADGSWTLTTAGPRSDDYVFPRRYSISSHGSHMDWRDSYDSRY